MNFLFNCFEFVNHVLDWIIHSNDPEHPTIIEYELQPVSSFRRTEPIQSPPLPSTSPQLRLRRQACEEEIQISVNNLVTPSIANEIKEANSANETNKTTEAEEPIDFEIIEMPVIEDQKKTS